MPLENLTEIMNSLLFSALVIALIYYFFFYLPTQKSNANQPLSINKAVQTEVELTEIIVDPGISKAEIEILKRDIQQKDEQIKSLSQDLTDSRKSKQKLANQLNANESLLKQLAKEMKELTQQLG